MTTTLKEDKQTLGNDIRPYPLFTIEQTIRINSQEIINEIQSNIKKLIEVSVNKDFLQTKLSICAKSLRDSGVQHTGFRLSIPSTVFGELSENFTWLFDIEGNSDLGTLEKNTYERAKSLKVKDSYSEDSLINIRMHTLFSLDEDMLNVYDNFYQQLNGNKEAAILLTSLAFYDLENLSKNRKEDLLLVDHMYAMDNINDRWLACLNISVEYIKPNNNYMSHLMH